MPENIVKKIRDEIAVYETTNLKINPSFAPRQQDILNLIDLYWMSKFKTGEYEGGGTPRLISGIAKSSGWRRSFFNVVESPTLVAMKMIDLDTKDIRIIAEEGQSYWPSWFFGKELKLWMKEQQIGLLLNEMVFKWPKYGHLLVKKAQDKLFVVNLQNVINDPRAKGFKNNPLIEVHHLTAGELEAEAEELGWDNADMVLTYKPGEDGYYTVYERFDPSLDTDNYHILYMALEGEDYVILKSGSIDDPYRELKWEDIPGRCLGRGQVERLFENQIAKNETENMFRKGLQWTSKHVFQTRDETMMRNLLTDVDNGELLRVQSEITPVAMEERNLASYRFSDEKWDANTEKRTFSFDIVRGERTPAGLPLGSAVLASQMAGSFFDIKREELGLFLKDIILKDILPQFKKEKSREHVVNLLNLTETDGDLEAIHHLLLQARTSKRIMNHVMTRGTWPTPTERNLFRAMEAEKLKRPEENDFDIPSDFYEDLKYKVDVLITSEQIDVASRLSTLQAALNILASNPSVVQDPRTREIFYELLELTGISPARLRRIEPLGGVTELAQSVAQQAGSMPRVTRPATPVELPQPTTV